MMYTGRSPIDVYEQGRSDAKRIVQIDGTEESETKIGTNERSNAPAWISAPTTHGSPSLITTVHSFIQSDHKLGISSNTFGVIKSTP